MEEGALGGDLGVEGRRWMGERVSREGEGCGIEGRRWTGEREEIEDGGLDGRRRVGERASGGDCGLEGRRRMGERVSRRDKAGTGDRVLILPPCRGIEGTTTFGLSSGLCVWVREGGRGD